MNRESKHKVIITTGNYIGTLTTIRELGKRGIETVLADSVWSPSKFSTFLHRFEYCPPLTDSKKFLSWLISYGRINPRMFLYPSCDNTAFLYSFNLKKLNKYFLMYSPHSDIIYRILNKKHLITICNKLSIDVPKSYFPNSLEELYNYAQRCQYPCLIKPQTQIGSITLKKGMVAYKASDLIEKYIAMQNGNSYKTFIKEYDPLVSWPIIQEFHPEAMSNTLSIAGFIDAEGKNFMTRASTKVMQKPRKIGIGLCFESTTAPYKIIEQCRQLCLDIGYFGAFEVEFIKYKDHYLLIDFNPRYYSQMEFEVRRQLNLPVLLYSKAIYDTVTFSNMVQNYHDWEQNKKYKYCLGWLFYLTIFCSWISHNMNTKEFISWIKWKREKGICVDAMYHKGDIKPFLYSIVQAIYSYIRHPRATFTHFFLER